MSKRPETGVMRFGDDWPGVFLRGDFANPLAWYLERLLNGEAEEMEKHFIRNFIEICNSSNMQINEKVTPRCQLPEYSECFYTCGSCGTRSEGVLYPEDTCKYCDPSKREKDEDLP